MTPWNTSGVIVRNVLVVIPDRLDDISFHDLHVVDVIEQPYSRRVDTLNYLYTKCGVVTHVIRVIDTAI